MTTYLLGLVSGVVATVVGGLLLDPIRARMRRYKQDKDEERLLRALIEMATEVDEHDKLSVPLSASRAATQAKLRDPEPVLERLVSKDHIRPDGVYPRHYKLTFEGRQRAGDARPSFWQLLSGK